MINIFKTWSSLKFDFDEAAYRLVQAAADRRCQLIIPPHHTPHTHSYSQYASRAAPRLPRSSRLGLTQIGAPQL